MAAWEDDAGDDLRRPWRTLRFGQSEGEPIGMAPGSGGRSPACIAACRPGKVGAGRRPAMGRLAKTGLLPDPRRRLRMRSPNRWPRHRCRHSLDGDQDRRFHDARRFAEAIMPVLSQMLAYNLSPSFNWDTAGMTGRGDAALPRGLGKWASSSTSSPMADRSTVSRPKIPPPRCARTACWRWLGCSARCAGRISYRTPQTLVGGPRAVTPWLPPRA